MTFEDVTPAELRGPSDEQKLQAATARIAVLEARLASLTTLGRNPGDPLLADGFVRVSVQAMEQGLAWVDADEVLRKINPKRVAGPGQVVVDAEEWAELNEYYEACDTLQETGDFPRRYLAWSKIHDRRMYGKNKFPSDAS